MRTFFFCLMILLTGNLLIGTTASAQLPRVISFQGVLADATGTLVSDGVHTIRIRLFDSSTGGTEVFAETQDVVVARGVFNASIGASSAGLPPSIDFDRAYYLALSINGGAELAPRTPLTAAPYSLHAASASIANALADGVMPSSLPPSGPAGGDLNGSYPDPSVTRLQGRSVSSAAPASGQVLKFNGSVWAPTTDDNGPWTTNGANIDNTNSGNVGIGTSSPATKLEVNGTTRTRDLQITSGAASGRMLVSNASGTAVWTTDMKIVGGNVGIGDTTPRGKLHVVAGSSGFDPSFVRTMVLEEDGHLTLSLRGPASMEQSILFERPVGDTGTRMSSQPDGDFRIGRYRFTDNGSASSSFHFFLDAQTGNVGIKRDPTANDFEVDGTASKLTAGDWLANSDRRIKTDVSDIEGSFATMLRLRPVRFRYNDEWRRKHPSIADRYYYNFIAQEYAQVFPDAVQGSGEHLEGDVNEILQIDTYDAQIVAIKAVQDLIRENASLRAANADLVERIERIESIVLAQAAAVESASPPH